MIARVASPRALAALVAAVAFGGAGVTTVLGCGAADLAVPSYPQPQGSAPGAPPEVVAFPPPPAPIEHLNDEPPARGCLWADGQWVWATQHWNWRPGAWVRPPEGCHYSAPTLQWVASGDTPGETSLLYYRPGRWYAVDEPKLCPDPVTCPVQSPRAQPQVNSPVDSPLQAPMNSRGQAPGNRSRSPAPSSSEAPLGS
jgi:hypothetical protein